MKTIPNSFPISIFDLEESEVVSQTITKKRCGIFYKGHNRNGGYITDEFADKLLSTLAYTPIKGIFNTKNDDFEGHGKKNDEGRIYGVVPADHNFAWEDHEDEDGVVRTYACADVYLFTALYEEAELIDGKGQSMELYAQSLKGDWTEVEGKYCFVYTDACFLGLQVLGDDVEPCFEGSAFFSKKENQLMFALLSQLTERIDKLETGEKQMNKDKIEFALSSNEKFNSLQQAMNNEETWRFSVIDYFDEYALVRDWEEGKFYKIPYAYDKESDAIAVSFDNKEEVFQTFVTVEDKNMLVEKYNTISATEIVANVEHEKIESDEKFSALEQKNAELSEQNADFTEKVSTFEATLAEKDAEIQELREYKNSIETQNKKAVIEKYASKLSEEVVNTYTEKMGEFSLTDLDKELAYELVKSDKSVFSADTGAKFTPIEEKESGMTALLSKYKKN